MTICSLVQISRSPENESASLHTVTSFSAWHSGSAMANQPGDPADGRTLELDRRGVSCHCPTPLHAHTTLFCVPTAGAKHLARR
ncbi:hypothetical protein Q8A67_020377 [Cirrhinus molitorella]|uniref:Uncharacterized protein n=1 Tax=Cirrhinus molitorella TaxID=172907 RepID=A0AA88PBS2_9TELE|nr:hypothetical protein Q8A67_020377 [Cirrhinus molitorella]